MISANSQLKSLHQARLLHWIIKHQLAIFFISTLLISWTIWGTTTLIPVENNTTLSRIILIGGYSPSLTAILLSSITKLSSRRIVHLHWGMVFIPALVLAIGSEWLDHIWWGHRIEASLILADTILVILVAFVITRFFTNHTDRHLQLTGITHWWVWIPVALGLWPVFVLLGNTIASMLGISIPPNPEFPNIPLPFIILESFLWAFLFGGPLNEEPGWRGFALPRLQSRFSPLLASIILGAIWGLWHVPQHLWGMYAGGPLGAILRIQEIPRAILFTWLYNRTQGNLLVVLLFHAAVNTTSYFITRSYEVVFILLFIVVIPIIISGKMWRKLPGSDSAENL